MKPKSTNDENSEEYCTSQEGCYTRTCEQSGCFIGVSCAGLDCFMVSCTYSIDSPPTSEPSSSPTPTCQQLSCDNLGCYSNACDNLGCYSAACSDAGCNSYSCDSLACANSIY